MRWKKYKLSLFMAVALVVYLIASSFAVMAETVDSDLQLNAIDTEGQESILHEPLLGETSVEESTTNEPLPELSEVVPLDESEGDIDEKPVEAALVPDKDAPKQHLDTDKESTFLPKHPTSAPMLITPMTIGPITSPIPITNYFPATGTSTNDHYSVVGVYITPDDNIHLILDNDKATAQQIRFYRPMLNGREAAGYNLSHDDYESYWQGPDTSMTLTYPDNTTKAITGARLFTFNLGPMMEYLQESNTLQILNSAGGFSIEGLTFTINIGHSITKTVDKYNATIGDELRYTITVQNTGQFRISGIAVTDTIPSGITILGVSSDGTNWNDATIVNEIISLDTNLFLASNASKTYYIKAYVNGTVSNGQTITNTASTGGNVPTETDTAIVTVQTSYVTIKKIVEGNFSDVEQAFPFTVIATKPSGHYTAETFNFNLTHNGTKDLLNLPTDAVLTLTEGNNNNYVVTVTVDGNSIVRNQEGKYFINIGSMNNKIVTVTNRRDVVIDTGITLDSLPYVLMLAFVIATMTTMAIRRRKIRSQD